MAIIPAFYIDAVVSIGIENGSNIQWIGTGFFVVKKVNEQGDALPLLVSNKHVLQGHDKIVIRMKKNGSQELQNTTIPLTENGKSLIVAHPDPNIDVAVILLNAGEIVQNDLSFPAFDIKENAMSSDELRNNGVDEGSLIHMLGFPMGLVNVNSAQPICRLGCIARINSAQIEESHNILVDIQNFPGNSGSPIVSRPEIVSIEGTKSLNKSVLIGIVHSYIPYRESLLNTQTKEIVEVRTENSGIANVHPVEFIREVIDLIPTFETIK